MEQSVHIHKNMKSTGNRAKKGMSVFESIINKVTSTIKWSLQGILAAVLFFSHATFDGGGLPDE